MFKNSHDSDPPSDAPPSGGDEPPQGWCDSAMPVRETGRTASEPSRSELWIIPPVPKHAGGRSADLDSCHTSPRRRSAGAPECQSARVPECRSPRWLAWVFPVSRLPPPRPCSRSGNMVYVGHPSLEAREIPGVIQRHYYHPYDFGRGGVLRIGKRRGCSPPGRSSTFGAVRRETVPFPSSWERDSAISEQSGGRRSRFRAGRVILAISP
jgi:hypothetical protein